MIPLGVKLAELEREEETYHVALWLNNKENEIGYSIFINLITCLYSNFIALLLYKWEHAECQQIPVWLVSS